MKCMFYTGEKKIILALHSIHDDIMNDIDSNKANVNILHVYITTFISIEFAMYIIPMNKHIDHSSMSADDIFRSFSVETDTEIILFAVKKNTA